MENNTENLRNRITNALEDEGVPKFYCNGFVNYTGSGDIMTVFERNGKPEFVLNMSYTVAKSFAQKLLATVNILQERTGKEMLTIEEVQEKLFSQGVEND